VRSLLTLVRASGLSYAKCCEEWHDRGEAIDPLVLVFLKKKHLCVCVCTHV
jgi:hypothetical protein